MQQTLIKVRNIVETMQHDGSFKTLIKALRSTGLIDTLRAGSGEYTLFAPSEKAFRRLSQSGQLGALEGDAARFAAVIRYHIIPRRIESRHTDGRQMIRTIEGRPVMIDTGGGFRVNNVEVLKPDIQCSNGIIHEIDGVLLPEHPY